MMKAPGFEGLTMENKQHVTFIQRLYKQSYRDVKKFLATKTHDQQLAFFEKDIDFRQRKLKDLLNHEDQKVKGDWEFAENNLMLKSQIICCTLSMAGIPKLDLVKNGIDYLIIDEACQAVETSTLIPFQLSPKRVILVGD